MENAPKKFKLKLRKSLGNNKTEGIFKNKTKEIKDNTNIILNNININTEKKSKKKKSNPKMIILTNIQVVIN